MTNKKFAKLKGQFESLMAELSPEHLAWKQKWTVKELLAEATKTAEQADRYKPQGATFGSGPHWRN